MASSLALRGELPDLAAERDRVDRGVPVELGLDRVVQLAQARGFHQAALDHGAHVVEILCEATLDLGEDLGIRVAVVDVDVAVPKDERAALAPAGQLRYEVRGRGELDVDA